MQYPAGLALAGVQSAHYQANGLRIFAKLFGKLRVGVVGVCDGGDGNGQAAGGGVGGIQAEEGFVLVGEGGEGVEEEGVGVGDAVGEVYVVVSGVELVLKGEVVGRFVADKILGALFAEVFYFV
jgi:hypothetical protein